jgi:type II secretory pathway pseudopilin PulG
MIPARQSFTQPSGKGGGFSLVEVTIAIGIFAFVIVAILGLFPVALKQRSDSALETRAVLVAQQVFESIRASPSSSSIFLPPLLNLSGSSNSLTSMNLSGFPLSLRYGSAGPTPIEPAGANEWLSGSTATSSGGWHTSQRTA